MKISTTTLRKLLFSDAANQFLSTTPHDQLFSTNFQLENNHVSDSPHLCFYFLTVISTTNSSTPLFLGKYKVTDSPHRELHLSVRNISLRNNVLTSCMLLCPALWHPVLSFGAPVAPPCPRRVVLLWRPIVTQWRSVTPCGAHRPRNNLTVRMGRQRAAQKKKQHFDKQEPNNNTHRINNTNTTNNQQPTVSCPQATTTHSNNHQQQTRTATHTTRNKQTNTQRQTNAQQPTPTTKHNNNTTTTAQHPTQRNNHRALLRSFCGPSKSKWYVQVSQTARDSVRFFFFCVCCFCWRCPRPFQLWSSQVIWVRGSILPSMEW